MSKSYKIITQRECDTCGSREGTHCKELNREITEPIELSGCAECVEVCKDEPNE